MKKSWQFLAVALSLSLIVLSAVVEVNYPRTAFRWNNRTQMADGIPMPPPQPPPKKTLGVNILVADGIPMPPPQPPPKKTVSAG